MEFALQHLKQDGGFLVKVFQGAGFEAAAGRLPVTFIPASGHTNARAGQHDRGGGLVDWLDYYYYDHKLLLRFTRPTG